MPAYRARLTAIYRAGEIEIPLVREGADCLAELPEQKIELRTDEYNFLGGEWGRDIPRGCARLFLTLTPLLEYCTVAQMQANLRERELQLMQNRRGTLDLYEGYHSGVPFLRTRWQAVVREISSRQLLPMDDALCDPSHTQSSLQGRANATISVTFSLTLPTMI